MFVAVQVAAGVLGVVLAHAMFDMDLVQPSLRERTGLGQWIAEGVATFGLVATILGTLRVQPGAVAAMVGLYITAGYWFTASTSFANPAVTVARGLTSTFSGIAPGDIAPSWVQFVRRGRTVLFRWLTPDDDAGRRRR